MVLASMKESADDASRGVLPETMRMNERRVTTGRVKRVANQKGVCADERR